MPLKYLAFNNILERSIKKGRNPTALQVTDLPIFMSERVINCFEKLNKSYKKYTHHCILKLKYLMMKVNNMYIII